MLAIILTIALQQEPTVAVTLPQGTTVISKVVATAEFEELCTGSVILVFDDGNLTIRITRSDAERLVVDPGASIDHAQATIRKTPIRPPTSEEVRRAAIIALSEQDQRLHALAAALNPMPDWPQFVMNNDASVCNRSSEPIVPVRLK